MEGVVDHHEVTPTDGHIPNELKPAGSFELTSGLVNVEVRETSLGEKGRTLKSCLRGSNIATEFRKVSFTSGPVDIFEYALSFSLSQGSTQPLEELPGEMDSDRESDNDMDITFQKLSSGFDSSFRKLEVIPESESDDVTPLNNENCNDRDVNEEEQTSGEPSEDLPTNKAGSNQIAEIRQEDYTNPEILLKPAHHTNNGNVQENNKEMSKYPLPECESIYEGNVVDDVRYILSEIIDKIINTSSNMFHPNISKEIAADTFTNSSSDIEWGASHILDHRVRQDYLFQDDDNDGSLPCSQMVKDDGSDEEDIEENSQESLNSLLDEIKSTKATVIPNSQESFGKVDNDCGSNLLRENDILDRTDSLSEEMLGGCGFDDRDAAKVDKLLDHCSIENQLMSVVEEKGDGNLSKKPVGIAPPLETSECDSNCHKEDPRNEISSDGPRNEPPVFSEALNNNRFLMEVTQDKLVSPLEKTIQCISGENGENLYDHETKTTPSTLDGSQGFTPKNRSNNNYNSLPEKCSNIIKHSSEKYENEINTSGNDPINISNARHGESRMNSSEEDMESNEEDAIEEMKIAKESNFQEISDIEQSHRLQMNETGNSDIYEADMEAKEIFSPDVLHLAGKSATENAMEKLYVEDAAAKPGMGVGVDKSKPAPCPLCLKELCQKEILQKHPDLYQQVEMARDFQNSQEKTHTRPSELINGKEKEISLPELSMKCTEQLQKSLSNNQPTQEDDNNSGNSSAGEAPEQYIKRQNFAMSGSVSIYESLDAALNICDCPKTSGRNFLKSCSKEKENIPGDNTAPHTPSMNLLIVSEREKLDNIGLQEKECNEIPQTDPKIDGGQLEKSTLVKNDSQQYLIDIETDKENFEELSQELSQKLDLHLESLENQGNRPPNCQVEKMESRSEEQTEALPVSPQLGLFHSDEEDSVHEVPRKEHSILLQEKSSNHTASVNELKRHLSPKLSCQEVPEKIHKPEITTQMNEVESRIPTGPYPGLMIPGDMDVIPSTTSEKFPSVHTSGGGRVESLQSSAPSRQTEDQAVPDTRRQVSPRKPVLDCHLTATDSISLYEEGKLDFSKDRSRECDKENISKTFPSASDDQVVAIDEGQAVGRRGSFKWSYAPSVDFDSATVMDDTRLEDQEPVNVIPVQPLYTCRKPLRLGLSKRHRCRPLHPNYRPQP